MFGLVEPYDECLPVLCAIYDLLCAEYTVLFDNLCLMSFIIQILYCSCDAVEAMGHHSQVPAPAAIGSLRLHPLIS